MAEKEKISRIDEDKALVAIIQDENSPSRRKEEAFNRLYSYYHNRVMFYLLKHIREREDAEDLKIQTFEKAYANISSYNKSFAFSTWMYKIAKNCLIDHKRKSNYEVLSIEALSMKREEGDFFEFQIKSDTLNPEEILSRDERIAKVKKAIQSLDNHFIRSLIIERYINELTFEQIAEKLGIEENSTLRVNVARGKEILREKLSSLNY